MTARGLRSIGIAAILAVAVASTGCDDASTATSPTTTSPVTELFSAQFIPGGGASRSFTAASAGTVSLTLSALGPPADLIVGLGVGIPQSNGSGCYLTQSVITGASSSPQLTVQVDAGVYCVRLWDLGTMRSATAFTVTIVRP
jgi:hypothetical protein